MFLTQPLHNAVQRDARRPLTICGDRVRSVGESVARVSRLAAGLRALGVGRGDRVALWSANSDRYHEMLLAVAWADAVVVPLNSRWTAEEAAFALADCAADVLVVDEAHLAAAEVVRERTSVAALIVMGDGAVPAGAIGFEELIASHQPIPDSRRGDGELLGVFYTGGTTGQPKGVMLSHANVFASAWGSLASGDFVTPSGRLLHAAPMFHLADLATWIAGLIVGSTHVIVDGFTPQRVLAAIEQHAVTDMLLVPTMIQVLAGFPDAGQFDTSSLVRLIYGGSPMPVATLAAARKLLPHTSFVQAYGMTELAPVATLLSSADHDLPHLIRSAGRAAPHSEVRAVDADANPVVAGDIGEITVRGDHVMAGYWQRPQETAQALRDGWLFTGDVGYLDEQGYLYVVDRIKDMIITGDENVYSAEVEDVLSLHPAVASCAVIGLPDPQWGERVHAIVVPRDGVQPTVDELRAFCRTKMAGFKLPRSVEYVRSLPISAAGKVLKRALRQERLG